MCGIAGFYSLQQKFNKEHLETMTTAIAHRGPDAAGYFFDGVCGLGHRRLSVLDLSEVANQPMVSQNGRYLIAFNGEVYNYQEIQQLLPYEIQQKLKTTSDTEVILELFAYKGIQVINEFNGMFAIAIYDKEEQKLYLIRDRIGVKPVYYYWDGQNFAFASELKALTKLPVPKEINHSAIADFLHLGYIPAPTSIYQHIYKMPSGSWIEISQKGIKQHIYWDLDKKISGLFLSNEQEAKTQLKALLQSSVRYRLISDVPLGVFLSGGIDSSLVAALATEQANAPVNTFSIGFEENKFNEAEYARQVAKHLGTIHHEFTVSTKEAKELIPELIQIYDEPYADSSAVPTMLVSKLAREHVTVALGGDGGDELFFGYGMYQWADRLSNPLYKMFRKPISKLLKLKATSSFQKASSLFNYPDDDTLPNHIFSQEQFLFSQAEIEDLLIYKTTHRFDPVVYNWEPASFNQSVFDLKYYLQDDLLVKVDRATMQFALEGRVPILDYRIIEFALNLSPDLKYKNGERKYLLKKVLYDYVPESFFQRPKQGFAIPLVKWLREDLKFLISNHLSKENVNYYGVINYEKVHQIKEAYLKGNDYFYNRLWSLIVLHQFLQIHELNK